ALFEERLRERPSAEWLERINAAGIPATPIYSVDQALESEIVAALEMVTTVAHATIDPLRMLGRPVTLGDARTGWLHRAPPLLGEQSVEICSELGLSDQKIRQLVADGVVQDASAASRRQELPA